MSFRQKGPFFPKEFYPGRIEKAVEKEGRQIWILGVAWFLGFGLKY
jgi:hypothetical protein